ncbi:MAG: flagellar motor protein MotA [Pseudomonadota bacterium]
MTRPHRYLFRMIIFLVIVTAGCAALAVQLREAFLANALLNGLILGVLVLGILYIFRQVLMLRPEINWIEKFQQESSGRLVLPGTLSQEKPPRLLSPMANMLGEKAGRLSLSTLSMRTLLDGIQSRIEESHDISRYLIGLLIFLGLLGTFWGLLETVNAVGDTISGLSGGTGDPAVLFEELKAGLATPLKGMGTAFSSSLFGLAGSLILGFLELQAGQAHNRFLNDLEEWLSGITKLSSGGAVGDGDQSVPAYIQALLEQTAESLDQLQRTVSRGESERDSTKQSLSVLGDQLGILNDHMKNQQAIFLSFAQNQAALKPVFTRIAEMDTGGGGLDESTRGHIRNLDQRLARLSTDVNAGRDQAVEELRGEIRLLTRTLAAMAEEA